MKPDRHAVVVKTRAGNWRAAVRVGRRVRVHTEPYLGWAKAWAEKRRGHPLQWRWEEDGSWSARDADLDALAAVYGLKGE